MWGDGRNLGSEEYEEGEEDIGKLPNPCEVSTSKQTAQKWMVSIIVIIINKTNNSWRVGPHRPVSSWAVVQRATGTAGGTWINSFESFILTPANPAQPGIRSLLLFLLSFCLSLASHRDTTTRTRTSVADCYWVASRWLSRMSKFRTSFW